MARLRYSGLKAALDVAIDTDDTAVTFDAPLTYYGGTITVPDIAGDDYLPLSLLNTDGLVTEIAYLTSYDHTTGAGTLTRAQEDSTGVAHAAGDLAINGPTPTDIPDPLPWFRVTTYGATGDGTTDDTDAINDAIAALNTAGKGVLYFPAGKYICTDELTTITAHAYIFGDGSGDLQGQNAATTLFLDATAGYLLTLAGDGTTIQQMGFENPTTTTQTAGAAIRVTQGDCNKYLDLTVRGFYNCVQIEDGALWQMDGCYLVGPVRAALHIAHIDLPDGGDMAVSNCNFYAEDRNAYAAIEYVSGGGLKLHACKVNTLFSTGWFTHGLAAEIVSETAVLTVTGCSIENVIGEAIACNGLLHGATITGNEIAYYGAGITVHAILIGSWFEVVITGNTIFADGGSTVPAISLVDVDHGAVGLNNWNGFTAEYAFSGTTTGITIAGAGADALADLSDVDLSTPASDLQVLTYDAADDVWKAADPAGATDLSDLTDVDFSTPPTDGQGFIYDASAHVWKPGDATPGSGVVDSVVAGSGVTVDDTDPANPIVSATGGGGGGTVTVEMAETDNSGDLTTGSTSFVDISALSLTIAASAGEKLIIDVMVDVYTSSLGIATDVAIVVAGTVKKVNVQVAPGTNLALPMVVRYVHTVASGDISSGTVAVKAQWRLGSGSTFIVNSSGRTGILTAENVG